VIAIVNYGVGNVRAIANIYARLGIDASIVSSPDELRRATRVILPGVGAFDWTMTHLNRSGLRDALTDKVVGEQCPVLGICVGMQMLARRSDEGALEGLGWIDAEVRKFDVATFSQRTHLPHMGWNTVRPNQNEGLFRDLGEDDARFYFLHSYYFAPDRAGDVLALTDYNGPFASGINHANIFGVQFHPEKSHQSGIKLLQNFAEL
jgi:glutamine amidotransferase